MDKLEIKADIAIDAAGTVTGLAWPFGSPDSVGDVIEPGAFNFANSLPMVMEHDQKQIVGVWESYAETDSGLEVKGRLFVEGIGPARDAHRQLKAGKIGGLSIGFQHQGFEPRAGGGRVFKSITVNEVSLCRRPVHPGARVTVVKSQNEEFNMEPELKNEQEAKADPVIDAKALDALKAETKARLDKAEATTKRPTAANNNHPNGENDNAIEMKALATFARTGDVVELKSVATDNDPAGGYFVLPTVDTTIRNLLKDLSPMRGLAEVVTIAGSGYERFYSKGKRGAQWVSERGDRPQDTARPDLTKHAYGTAEMYAAPTTTRQALDDSSMDVASWLINSAIHDFAETEGEAFLSGDGIDGSPKGLLVYPLAAEKDFAREWGKFQYVAAGNATPTDKHLADALIKLVATLRKPYKARPVFLMNSATAIRLRQIVDTTNRYLWAPTGNLIEGVDHPLLGHRVEIDEGMPDIGADVTPIAFGDFNQGYVIVDRQGVRVTRDEVTQKGRVIFDTYKRVGGGAGDFNAIKFLKIAAA